MIYDNFFLLKAICLGCALRSSQKAKMAIFVVFEIFGVRVKKNNEEAENCMEYVEIWCMGTTWGILKRLGTVHSVNIEEKPQ